MCVGKSLLRRNLVLLAPNSKVLLAQVLLLVVKHRPIRVVLAAAVRPPLSLLSPLLPCVHQNSNQHTDNVVAKRVCLSDDPISATYLLLVSVLTSRSLYVALPLPNHNVYACQVFYHFRIIVHSLCLPTHYISASLFTLSIKAPTK